VGNDIGPVGQGSFDVANDDFIVVKHNILGPNNTGMRRGTRNHTINENSGGTAIAFYDNIIRKGTGRVFMIDYAEAAFGEYVGFNYQQDQGATAPVTGNFCDGTGVNNTNDPNFIQGDRNVERSIFFLHQTDTDSPSGFLIENNDLICRLEVDPFTPVASVMGFKSTLFRNRFIDTSKNANGTLLWATDSNTSLDGPAWIANRAHNWSYTGGAFANILGRWNVQTNSGSGTIGSPGGTGTNWDATNQSTTSTNSNCPLNMPASLAFRTNTPPTWWCQESGDWNNWTMGACDGAAPPKLPAQIRSEGGTCTPPNGSTSLAPPFLESVTPKP
jgi:hypothetical protein